MNPSDLLPTAVHEAWGEGRARDPRWKLVTAISAAATVLALQRVATIWFAVVLALIAAGAAMPWRVLVRRMVAFAPVVALFALPLPLLLTGSGATYEWGPFALSAHGISVGGKVAGKMLAVFAIVTLTLTSTSLEALLSAARALHVPGLLVQLAMLAHRYLYVLADEFARMRTALRVRGYRNRASAHCYRTIGHVAGTMLVRGHDRAERVGQAMRCRGFDGRWRSLTEFQTRRADLLLFGGILVGGLALVGLDRFLL